MFLGARRPLQITLSVRMSSYLYVRYDNKLCNKIYVLHTNMCRVQGVPKAKADQLFFIIDIIQSGKEYGMPFTLCIQVMSYQWNAKVVIGTLVRYPHNNRYFSIIYLSIYLSTSIYPSIYRYEKREKRGINERKMSPKKGI